MNTGYEGQLGDERLDRYHEDAEHARQLGWWHQPSGRALRDAGRVGAIVQKALSATARCRWNEVENALERLEHEELRPAAQIAIRAIYAQARGDEAAAEGLCRQLHSVPVSTNADSEVWASGVIAASLHGYLGGTVDDSSEPVALVRQMCARFGALHLETTQFMCLSLALLARAGGSPVLASFLLGHLTETAGPPRVSAAVRAATACCIIALGDERTGSRLLLELLDGNEAARMPLVTGLAGAEMARIELEHGDRSAAAHWIDRTRRFAQRYHSQLPVQVIGRVRTELPGADG